jgi:hypothetical protein
MSDEPKKRSWAWIGWTAVVLFVLYPLSAGPTQRLTMPWIRGGPWDTVYSPLLRLTEHDPSVKRIFDWWLGIWEYPDRGRS